MSPTRRTLAILVLGLAALSTAPAPPGPPTKPSHRTPLAEARYRAALEQYELEWSYFKQNRTQSLHVYVWSRLVLDARRDMGETPDDRIAALREHLERMRKMEDLIRRIYGLGFGVSADIGATRYYRLEAEHWLAQAGEKGR